MTMQKEVLDYYGSRIIYNKSKRYSKHKYTFDKNKKGTITFVSIPTVGRIIHPYTFKNIKDMEYSIAARVLRGEDIFIDKEIAIDLKISADNSTFWRKILEIKDRVANFSEWNIA